VLFSKKETNSYLGIDFGRTGIKVVELKHNNDRFELSAYALAEFSADTVAHINNKSAKDVAQLIKKVCGQAKISSTKAIVSISAFSVFTSILRLPNLSIAELDIVIRSEVKKLIHLQMDDVVVYWQIMSPGANMKQNLLHTDFEYLKSHVAKDDQASQLSVFLTVIPKDIIKRYKDIFSLSGLRLVSIEIETLAMARALLFNDPSCVMIVDLGGVSTSIILIDNGIPVFSKSIEVGGSAINIAIQKMTGLDIHDTEQMKNDVGVIFDMGDGSLQVAGVAQSLISTVIDEVLYIINFYNEHIKADKKIDKILLTGGSAFLPNLDKYIASTTNIQTYVGDSWFHVGYDKELQPLLYKIGQKMCVAIGLAMQGGSE